MKVSKRQLKRIIKEEKVKILKEQGGGGDLTPEQEAKAMEIITASFEMLENDLYENGIEMAYMGQFSGLLKKALERW
jgi:hypothetical protein